MNLRAVYKIPLNFQAQTGFTVGLYAYAAVSPANTNYTNLLGGSAEWAAQSKLFDEFCVTKVTAEYIPFINVQSTAIANGDPRIHSFVDRDGNTPVNNSVSVPNKLQGYDSYKESSIYKRFKRTIKCSRFWMDTSIGQINPQAEAGTAQPWVNAGLCQVMGFYAQNLPVTTAGYNLGCLTYYWHVEFRGKKTTSFTYDPVSGSVTMTPIENFPADIAVTTTRIGNEQDEIISCDASGNMVVESTYTGYAANVNNDPWNQYGRTGPTGPTGPAPV